MRLGGLKRLAAAGLGFHPKLDGLGIRFEKCQSPECGDAFEPPMKFRWNLSCLSVGIEILVSFSGHQLSKIVRKQYFLARI
jgi:hypothetical protein